ncbi:MAG: FkbM family methyltransferase [Planctomycetia bacterium]|nr:FkbM family methyltransferase [Planctomycetia bacterium]
MRDGTVLKVDLRSRMERHVYWRGEFDPTSVGLFEKLLVPGATVIDIGASIGFFSVPLARAVARQQGHVYAIEPVPANFERLCENLRLNGLEGVCTPFHLALGKARGIAKLTMDDDVHAVTGNAVAATIAMDTTLDFPIPEPWATNAPVFTDTLDDFADRLGPLDTVLVKMDVEGGEYEILQSSTRFVARHQPIFYCELNYRRMRKVGWTVATLNELISPWNYEMHHHDGRGLVAGCIGGPDTEDVFLLPRDQVESVRERPARQP